MLNLVRISLPGDPFFAVDPGEVVAMHQNSQGKTCVLLRGQRLPHIVGTPVTEVLDILKRRDENAVESSSDDTDDIVIRVTDPKRILYPHSKEFRGAGKPDWYMCGNDINISTHDPDAALAFTSQLVTAGLVADFDQATLEINKKLGK